jgi:hypothetical protein
VAAVAALDSTASAAGASTTTTKVACSSGSKAQTVFVRGWVAWGAQHRGSLQIELNFVPLP